MNSQQATALRAEITRTLHACAVGPLAGRATALLGALGYHSDKTLALSPNDFAGFQEAFLDGRAFSADKALAAQWQSVDLLFQYTDAEVKASNQLALDVFADPRFDAGVYQSFVFFAVDLTGDSYTRTQLADATREINKPFGMPAIVLFRHGATLTLAVIDRRLNKRDGTRDVLEKVTLIKDIRCTSPHRAHIEILADLTLDSLLESQPITNFDTLHTAWRKTLDTAALNKKFYKELADWYFWARKHVTFPPQTGVTAEVNHATNVIRLITRLMFTWFLKERGLVPEELFDERKLTALLQDPDLTGDGSTYYKAILQNLFFATLNTEMNDPVHPRRFRGESQTGGRDSHYGVTNVCRYADAFQDSARALALFKTIPFLNGGLFECLDQTAQGATRVLVDGFSDRADNPLRVPNFLFFSSARDVDLNADYGTAGKITKVRGLLTILNSYKFTVAENTPIEEEIALDPELLGRVFENLLASYNPETGATARKQTGSFYTPREIVNYMVDEALIASLETALTPPVPASVGAPLAAPSSPSPSTPFPNREGSALAPGVGSEGLGLNARLRHLFAYNTNAPDFSPPEINTLINAIDALKILDPACGSGAFPMGILQKLVFVLGKLDPQNAQWRDRQIAKAELIDDPTARDHAVADIVQAFDKNDLDYGRKLYLISNGIYGVDIQPIAMQIAKLRFFISLIIDQRIDDEAKNRGVRALPNLETKFVAANTLLGIDRPKDKTLTLGDREVLDKQEELTKVRARYFSARTPALKAKCKEEDKQLRADLSALLEGSGLPHETALRLAGWDPYDQNQSANFFDPEWMYGIDKGFDIVIANPPYVRPHHMDAGLKKLLWQHYRPVFEAKSDLYACFIQRSIELLKPHGLLSMIVSKTWLALESFEQLRRYILRHSYVRLLAIPPEKTFESATVETVIFLFEKATTDQTEQQNLINIGQFYEDHFEFSRTIDQSLFAVTHLHAFDLSLDSPTINLNQLMVSQSRPLNDCVHFYYGIKTGDDSKFITSVKQDDSYKPLLRRGDIGRYSTQWKGEYVWYVPSLMRKHRQTARPGEPARFEAAKIILLDLAKRLVATIDVDHYYVKDALLFLKQEGGPDLRYVLALINSRLLTYYYAKTFTTLSVAKNAVLTLPIKQINLTDAVERTRHDTIVSLVDQTLAMKAANSTARIDEYEDKINKLVYDLYGLDQQQVYMVEGAKEVLEAEEDTEVIGLV